MNFLFQWTLKANQIAWVIFLIIILKQFCKTYCTVLFLVFYLAGPIRVENFSAYVRNLSRDGKFLFSEEFRVRCHWCSISNLQIFVSFTCHKRKLMRNINCIRTMPMNITWNLRIGKHKDIRRTSFSQVFILSIFHIIVFIKDFKFSA